MFKTTLTIVMATLCLIFKGNAQPATKPPVKNQILSGRVISASTKLPLPGAVLKISNSSQTILSNDRGEFSLNLAKGKYQLSAAYLNHQVIRIQVEVPLTQPLIIALQPAEETLKEIEIVSTGYQKLPKERATGSFEVVDNKLFNRSTGTDVFSRLDAVTTGTLFLKGNSSLRRTPFDGMIIRGNSGLNGQRPPLIVLDNFPYDGDPNDLNPNDVESITLLKDAAASSIWGTQAGNGVIVITTRKGSFNQPFRVSLNTNLSIIAKPDLKYLKSMNSNDYIDVEQMLFSKGFYDRNLNPRSPFKALSPVVEILNRQRAGELLEADANAQINALRGIDVRDDFLKYVYRKASKQQYALSVSVGDQRINYLLSAGYDKNLNNLKTSDYARKTFRLNNTIRPVKNLEIETGLFYTRSNERLNSTGSQIEYGAVDLGASKSLYPYAKFADENGTPLAVPKYFRTGFTDTIGRGILQDWKYRPLNELNSNNNTITAQSLLVNAGVKYTFNSLWNAEIRYQFEKGSAEQRDAYNKDSFYTRHLVNVFTQFKNGVITAQPVPVGDILNSFNRDYQTQGIRGQLNFNKIWGDKHQLSAIAGTELRETLSSSSANVLYGYDPETLTFQNVDLKSTFPLINGRFGNSTVPGLDASNLTALTNRFVSLFTNAAYIYDNRYIVSLSARKDEANLFGLASNAKGLPLWSAGLSWNISNEKFWNLETLPYLKFRATYGYSGNADNTVPAFATITYAPGSAPTNLPYATSTNPPNSKLRWEKIGMLNLGLDFAFKNNRITGSVEYYRKRSTDLLAPAPIDASTGFQSLTYNSAIINGKGIETNIKSRNISTGGFEWTSNLLFSFNRPIVERYLLEQRRARDYALNSGSLNPIEGQDIWAMYAFKFAGLDHESGNPKGYFEGAESTNYSAILNKSKVADLEYFGSSKPLYFGALRNTFEYQGFSLSLNVSFRFAYYFRRSGLDYDQLFNYGNGHTDFAQRWQAPGDEAFTKVPSMIYGHPDLYNRSLFYAYSTALVEKGDNIRLEDINLAYAFKTAKYGFKSLRLYANLNNPGILWKANKAGLDPDYGYASNSIPPARTLVFGASVNF